MTWVNDKSYHWYSGYDDQTVNMIEQSYGKDENDHINLKKMKEPTIVVGGNGKDKIWGSTKHMNEIFGDQVWEFGEGNPADYDSYSGKDTIYGGDASDLIHGGLSNDKMYGKDGVNIFQFKKGDGKDTIVMGRGDDYLYFCDSSVSELTFIQKNKDLIVKYSENDQVTVKDYYKTFGHVSLKGIADKSFNMTTVLKEVSNILAKYDTDSEWQLTRAENKVEDYLEKTLKSLPSPKSIYEKTGMTIIRTKGGESKGTDAADIITGSKRKDRLYGRDGDDLIKGGKGSDRLYGDNGNDTIYGENGNDIIEGGKGNDTINGGKGNDKIYGVSGTNFITGSKGNDKIYSGSGVDTFYYAKGAGKDTIYNANSSDKIRYKDVASMSDLKFARKRNDIIITRKNGSKKETITLSDFFRTSKKLDKIILSDGTTGSILQSAQLSISGSGTIDGTEYNETIKGSFRADTIYGRGGNDKITGHKGADTINAGKGTNSIYFGRNDGKDVVLSGGGVDTLVFKKQSRSDLSARYSGSNAIIYYKGGTVLLKNYKKGGHSAQYVKTTSGIYSVDDLLPYNKINPTTAAIAGTDLKDKITTDYETKSVDAKGGNDLINVYGGDIDIKPGKGNDTLNLYNADNKIHFYAGDGADTIQKLVDEGYMDNNTLIFENESNVSGLQYTANSKGYKITYNGGADSVTTNIKNPGDTEEDYFGLGNEASWDIVKLKSGATYLTTQKGLIRNYFGDTTATTLSTGDEVDYIATNAKTINAKGGNDYIALMTNDATQITAGRGDDEILISAKGNRTFNFSDGDGKDIIYDENVKSGSRGDTITYSFNSNVEVNFNSEGVVISYNNGADSVTIKNKSDISYDDYSNVDFGYVKVGTSDAVAISSYFTAPEDPGDIDTDSLNSLMQIMAETVSFTSSGSSDVPPQIVEDNKQDLSALVSAYVNTDNAFAALA